MNKKGLFLSLVLILSLIVLGSCDNTNNNIQQEEFEQLQIDNNIFKYIPEEKISFYGHIEKVDFFDSDISVGYRNEDGSYTAYIFASPIRYKKGTTKLIDIDNRLVSIKSSEYKEHGYIYRNNSNDIYSYFPSEVWLEKGFLVESPFYSFEFGTNDSNTIKKFNKQIKKMFGELCKKVLNMRAKII